MDVWKAMTTPTIGVHMYKRYTYNSEQLLALTTYILRVFWDGKSSYDAIICCCG